LLPARPAHHPPPQQELELKRTRPEWPAAGSSRPVTPGSTVNRALLIRSSKKPQNHLALLQLACGLIAFKKAHAARLAQAPPGQALSSSPSLNRVRWVPARQARFAAAMAAKTAAANA
jgi:hypothetical protein